MIKPQIDQHSLTSLLVIFAVNQMMIIKIYFLFHLGYNILKNVRSVYLFKSIKINL
ncbi:hypothetical protein Sgly_1738 [Syntrophobotulus glycolicus DSM 8271]|uniref:Uncharacterized protein n=1 Tax=Syntrophobotulus glycolicus (strain DSM 8271 / FlGlyR) TaxID=645991 RepID=F0SYZ8_SYNGF|nr:hypothetical protein Sgly_1738 [Syntrophobotulus glycolicus DSM 8271]